MAAPTARDVDITFRVSANRMPIDGSLYAYALARRQAQGTEYRLKLRIGPDGAGWIQATRRVLGTEKSLWPEARVRGLTYPPGMVVWVRGRVIGSNHRPRLLQTPRTPAMSRPTATMATTIKLSAVHDVQVVGSRSPTRRDCGPRTAQRGSRSWTT
jgi:hypothetical protein